MIKTQAESIKIKDRQTSDAINQTSEVIELLKEQLKKGQYVETPSRVANLVVEEEDNTAYARAKSQHSSNGKLKLNIKLWI